jgi:hypothetical protein
MRAPQMLNCNRDTRSPGLRRVSPNVFRAAQTHRPPHSSLAGQGLHGFADRRNISGRNYFAIPTTTDEVRRASHAAQLTTTGSPHAMASFTTRPQGSV